MKSEVFTNRLRYIRAELSGRLLKCTSFAIASSFIDSDAIDMIENTFAKNKSLKEVKILIGTFGYFNKKADLERLQKIALRYPALVQIRVSRSKNFHWKLYHFIEKRKNHIYIGSANFTNGGLQANNEILVKLSPIDGGLNKLQEEFEFEWAVNNSGSIVDYPVDKYPENKLARTVIKAPKELQLFYNYKHETTEPASANSEGRAFLTYLTHDVKAYTVKAILNQKPSWKEDFFVCDTLREVELCKNIKRIFIIDRHSRGEYYLYQAEYVGSLSLDKRTEDGKHFVAYKMKKTKKLSSKALDLLGSSPFNFNLEARKNILGTKVLGHRQVKMIESIFT